MEHIDKLYRENRRQVKVRGDKEMKKGGKTKVQMRGEDRNDGEGNG